MPSQLPAVHHQPRGLVDHQQFRVLMHDDQRNDLRLNRGRGGGLRYQRDPFATPDPMLGRCWRAIQQGRALADPGLQPAAGEFGKQGTHGLIQSLASQLGWNHGGEGMG